jgi:hypothetical protein
MAVDISKTATDSAKTTNQQKAMAHDQERGKIHFNSLGLKLSNVLTVSLLKKCAFSTQQDSSRCQKPEKTILQAFHMFKIQSDQAKKQRVSSTESGLYASQQRLRNKLIWKLMAFLLTMQVTKNE